MRIVYYCIRHHRLPTLPEETLNLNLYEDLKLIWTILELLVGVNIAYMFKCTHFVLFHCLVVNHIPI